MTTYGALFLEMTLTWPHDHMTQKINDSESQMAYDTGQENKT